MFNKALWNKEYKQAKFILWSMWIVLFLGMPIQVITRLQNLTEYEKNELSINPDFKIHTDYFYDNVLNFTSIYVVLLILIFILASLLIGSERGNKTNDFTFSLPFSRKQIFLSKWMIGTTFIVSAFILNFIFTQVIIYFSEYQNMLNFEWSFIYFIYPFIAFVALYVFALFFGTITGGFIYQAALTFIFFIFPLGIYFLLGSFFENVLKRDLYDFFYEMDILFLGNYFDTNSIKNLFFNVIHQNNVVEDGFYSFISYDYQVYYYFLLIPVFYTLILLPLSVFLYERNKVENNGKFLLFPQLNKFFMFGIVICFALLGGIIGTAFVPYRLNYLDSLFYIFGFIGFGILSYYLTRKLYNVNLKISSR
ncbi:ABC-2 transporter permease [Chengkuizengella sediminis]|uniref:ABC-2 transporter permease n=1 Tax=Chengkuizengella sediminis TaxID=1885917 RepID=UPI0013895F4C|nr:ABC-2 transporter permease [Chengkuizengella sediminis]NDI35557.1 ABC transporter permease subunit [Chengkuizengella sediminis]